MGKRIVKLDTPTLRAELQSGRVEQLELRRVKGGVWALKVSWRNTFSGPAWLHLQRAGEDGKPVRSERKTLDGWTYAIERLDVPAFVRVVVPTKRGQGDASE